jgi:ABC-type sugar transport system ATPase subunit
MSTTEDVVAAPVLELRGVTVRFGSVPALSRVSLALRAGEVTCVLGENGSGKSTLVAVVSGVLRPRRGSCWSTASRCASARRSRRAAAGSPPSGRTWPSPR